MNVQILILQRSTAPHPGSAAMVLHDVDVQVGGGVEDRHQVRELCHPVYHGWELCIQLG